MYAGLLAVAEHFNTDTKKIIKNTGIETNKNTNLDTQPE